MENQTPEPAIEQTPQPEAVESTAPVFGDDGKFTEDYLKSLPEDLGNHSIFQKYNSVADLAKGAINAQSLAGKKAEDFWTSEDPNDVARRREIMGVPKDVSGYEISVGEVPDGMPLDNERIDAFKEFALERNIPAETAQALIEWDVERASEAWANIQEQNATQTRETEEALRQEWKGDKYDINIDRIKGTLEAAGLGDWVEDPAFANNPVRLKQFLDKIVPLFSDDAVVEARMKESRATLDDKLREVEGRMNAYAGGTNEPAYLNMVRERSDLLTKLTQ
jgi:hypothetical protein